MNPNVNWFETLTLVLLVLLVVVPAAKVLITSSLETVRIRSRVHDEREYAKSVARTRGNSAFDAHGDGR